MIGLNSSEEWEGRGGHTIDTEMKAKRDNIISELITFRITKAKAKENSGGGGSN